MKYKFYFAFFIDWIISAIVLIGISLYLKLPMLAVFFLLSSYTAGTYMTSIYYFMRDYRLLDLAWNNFSELMQRGVSQAVRIFIQLVILFFGILVIFGILFWFVFVISDTARLFVSIGIFLLLSIGLYGMYTYAEKNFWPQSNQRPVCYKQKDILLKTGCPFFLYFRNMIYL